MEKNNKSDSYSHILKYTGIFGGVQGLNILISVVRNKFATLLIGASGLGLLSLFNSTINMFVSACNLGIPTSGVQELSDKYTSSSPDMANSIRMIRSWSFAMAIVGALLCAIVGPLLNQVSFSWGDHTLHFVLLSPAVAFTIIAGGELAVLKATRQLRALALSSFLVIVFSLLFSVPVYYFWGQSGIVVVLVALQLVQMATALRYSCRFYPYQLNLSAVYLRGGMHIIRLGLAFVLAGVMNSGAEFLIRTFINNRGDLDHVGYFNAGWTIAVVYGGLIFTAMESDYFPRLSSIKGVGEELSSCVNKQMEMNILLVGPILTVMLFLLPVLIPILYDGSFLVMLPLAQFATLSMLFKAVYLPVEYLPLSKGKSVVFLFQEGFAVLLLVFFELMGYDMMQLMGLGVGIALAYLVEAICVLAYSRVYFSFRVSKNFILFATIQVIFSGLTLFVMMSGFSALTYWLCAALLSVLDILSSLYLLKKKTDVLDVIYEKIRRRL